MVSAVRKLILEMKLLMFSSPVHAYEAVYQSLK